MKFKLIGISLLMILLMGVVMAADFTPQGDINLRDTYEVINATNISANYYCDQGEVNCYDIDELSNSTSNSTTWWDGHNDTNSTQFENNGGTLSIIASWFSSFFDSLFGAKDTDDLTEGSTNLYDNESWNESHADTKYSTIDEPLWSDNSTTVARVGDCPAGQVVQNTTTSGVECSAVAGDITSVQGDDIYIYNGSNTGAVVLVLNETKLNETIGIFNDSATAYTDAVNSTQQSWVEALFVKISEIVGLVGNWSADQTDYYNKTEVDTNITDANTSATAYTDAVNSSQSAWTTSEIIAANATMKTYADGTFITLADEGNLNVNNSNTSDWWAGFNDTNATQFENNDGTLNIISSWFSDFFDSLFSAKDTDDLTEGSTNLYDNQSWNESWGDLKYSTIDEPLFTANLTAHNTSWSANTNCSVAGSCAGIIYTSNDTDDLPEGSTNLYDNQSWNETWAEDKFRLESWDNFTGVPHATPSNGDVTHFSWADEIYDWVIGLAYLANIVEDTTPQLGGYLDANGQNIGSTSDEIENVYVGTTTRVYFGDGQEASVYYNGTNLIISG